MTEVMGLVIDKATRRVIDCAKFEPSYSWYFQELCDKHDLTKVEILIRAPEATKPVEVEDVVEAPPVEPTPTSDDDHIPF